MPSLRPRQIWGIGVLVACAGLLALVAVASEGSPLHAPLDDATAGSRWLGVAEVLGLLVAGAALVLVALALFGERARRPQFRTRRRFLPTALILAVVLFGSLPLIRERHRAKDETNPRAGAPPPAVVSRTSDRPTWPVIVLGGAVVAALAWAAFTTRRRASDGLDDATGGEDQRRVEAVAVFDESLEDLEREPDPRAAIIAAYRRLLDGLDRCGLGRRRHEAPVEHLRRALASLDVRPAPMQQLVDLYSEARFSEHSLTAAHKRAAIDAFRAARDDLVMATAAATA